VTLESDVLRSMHDDLMRKDAEIARLKPSARAMEALMEMMAEFGGQRIEMPEEELTQTNAFINAWSAMKDRAEYAESQLAAARPSIAANEESIVRSSRKRIEGLEGVIAELQTELAAARSRPLAWLPGGARGGTATGIEHCSWHLIVVAGDVIGAVWFDCSAPVSGFREESNESALWLFASVDYYLPISSIPVPE